MSTNLFSQTWYRVAALKPRVRPHAQIHRHQYRDQVWYVLEDHSSGRYHRFTPAAHQIIGLLDGEHTVQSIWETVSQRLGDDAPTQDETIQLLGQLHAADLLQSDVPPDTVELFRRHQQYTRRKWMQRLLHPLAVRFPLFDPERLLEAGLPLARPFFSWFGAVLWSAVVLSGIVLAASHWTELTENLVDRVLTPHNLLLLWLAYPIVKALHEFGHAFATKVWGGEVHEMGIMLLVLMPIPYVEASAASAFPDKRKRIVVGAAGIMVELFLAAVALIVWLNVEPGTVRTIAYNVMLIGGVSTLFFNGNPLLRFDGYYVLADTLEIPNLATRSKRYLGYLIQRYLFGVREALSPATAPGERAWFLVYGLASFAYRLFIICVIIIFIAGKFFILGGILAVWAVTTQVILPVLKGIGFILTSPRLRRTRARAMLTSGAVVGALAAVLFLVPAPYSTRAQGVVWLPEQSQVRAGADGFVSQLLVAEGSEVQPGEVLIKSEDPFLRTRVELLEGRVRELDARLAEQQFVDRALADVIRKEMAAANADLSHTRERLDALAIRSPTQGVLVVPKAQDLAGRFVHRGEVLGYVMVESARTVRVVVPQDDIGLVRERTLKVGVTLADWGAKPIPARIVREVPGASDRLPTVVLGSTGGGPFPVDPRDPSQLKTLEKVFQLDLIVPEGQEFAYMGGRVHVRFDHGAEPLGLQWYRSARQLFLSRFGV